MIFGLLSVANLSALSLIALGGVPKPTNAAVVQLFVDPSCPAENPGPVCTNVGERECCKDHVGDIANYYSSGLFQGLESPDYYVASSWNRESKCEAASISYGNGCKHTPGGFRNAYGFFWYKSWYPYPPPDARSIIAINKTTTIECTKSIAPDVHFIKLAANVSAVPVAREVLLKMEANVGPVSGERSMAGVGVIYDRNTGIVKEEMKKESQEVLAKHGNGLSPEQVKALRMLKDISQQAEVL